MIHLIKEIEKVEPFSLTLLYNTGETVKVDLESKLREWSQSPGSKFKKLLNGNYFASVKPDEEAETIYWDNGIDLCPDVLYLMGEVVTAANLSKEQPIY